MNRILASALIAIVLAGCRKAEQPAASSTSPARKTGAGAQAAVDSDDLKVGAAMPAYSGPTLDGSSFALASEKGNVVFLNLWATWCGPCRFEIPELEQLHQKYQGRGFKVVGVSVDEGAPQAVKEFVVEQKMTYPVVLDPDGKLAVLLRTTILPTSVIVDRQGKIVWKKYGPILPNDPTLLRALESALGRT
jgi:thiol-disulfide isomerase/thioredoxin